MAATALTVATVIEAGVALNSVVGDTANGNSFANTNGNVFVYLKNTHATNSQSFVITAQTTSVTKDGYGVLTKASTTVAVPALSDAVAGPFPTSAYNDASGLVQVTFSGTGTPRIQAFTVNGLAKV